VRAELGKGRRKSDRWGIGFYEQADKGSKFEFRVVNPKILKASLTGVFFFQLNHNFGNSLVGKP
jgi:hypothetical protein